MSAGHILVVAKRAQLDLLSEEELARMTAAGVADRRVLEAARAAHEKLVAQTLELLSGDAMEFRRVDQLQAGDGKRIALVISIGGDGTLFTISHRLPEAPILVVNSDPARSYGHYTRCTAAELPALLAAWREGRTREERLPRLAVDIDGHPSGQILNDCLFTNESPAALSRYTIICDGVREQQRSSGVWVATRGGASAAIGNAGFPQELVPPETTADALLFQVREPLREQGSLELLHGCQHPARELVLIAANRHTGLWIDGCHIHHPVPAGCAVRFRPAGNPARLVVD